MEVKIEASWKKVLAQEFEQPYFKELVNFVKTEYATQQGAIFPPAAQIFRAFDACPFDEVKVVILGQDPYPTRGHAHGLCFSVEKTVRPFPKSLINIFKEIQDDIGGAYPQHGDLNHLAQQGVLLLNSVLTVREGAPASHANKGWERFTDAVISILSREKKELVYLLWGSHAIKKASSVDGNQNLILTTVHPSPLSAYRGFFGCKHFSQTNSYLINHNKQPIQWVEESKH